MNSIRTEFAALDTNEFVHAVVGDNPASDSLFFRRIRELRIFIPLQVIIELNHNLLPNELRVVRANLRRALEVRWDTAHPDEELFERYQALGARRAMRQWPQRFIPPESAG